MKKGDLKHWSRAELLEEMLRQSEEIDQLKKEVDSLRLQLIDKKILISESGSIAEAAIAISEVFERAQQAADLYLLNIKRKANEEKKKQETLHRNAASKSNKEGDRKRTSQSKNKRGS